VLSRILNELQEEHSRQAEFAIPADHLNNVELITQRVKKVPSTARSALHLVLSYLYLTDGPINLRNTRYREAEPYLNACEIVMSRYLKHRTNGSGKRAYGKPALRHMREVGYKCECCGFKDVRALNLDHAYGGGQLVFLVLCANCHNIKSRRFDWLGNKRPANRD